MPTARARVESANACDKFRAIGEIEIVNALREAGFDYAIARIPVRLKWSACINHDVRPRSFQLRIHIAVAV